MIRLGFRNVNGGPASQLCDGFDVVSLREQVDQSEPFDAVLKGGEVASESRRVAGNDGDSRGREAFEMSHYAFSETGARGVGEDEVGSCGELHEMILGAAMDRFDCGRIRLEIP